MKKIGKWWKVPAILSAVLGLVPAGYVLSGLIWGRVELAIGALGILVFVGAAIWIPTAIVMGIRKLRHKATV
jgi:predicted tellurium resistance membrane protein TerC